VNTLGQINYTELFLQTDLSGISSRARKNPEERNELEKRIKLFTAWAKLRGIYKESQATKSWWSVLGKRTPSQYWSHTKEVEGIQIFDHVSLYLSKDNGKILTSHPYMDYTENEKETIKEWGREKGLKILIHPSSKSWYYPEQTSFIEIMKVREY
jgi:hypothetical protein